MDQSPEREQARQTETETERDRDRARARANTSCHHRLVVGSFALFQMPRPDGFTADDAGNFGEAQSVKGKIIQVTNAVRTLLRVPLIGESSRCAPPVRWLSHALFAAFFSGVSVAVIHRHSSSRHFPTPRRAHCARFPNTGLNLVTVVYLIFLG